MGYSDRRQAGNGQHHRHVKIPKGSGQDCLLVLMSLFLLPALTLWTAWRLVISTGGEGT